MKFPDNPSNQEDLEALKRHPFFIENDENDTPKH